MFFGKSFFDFLWWLLLSSSNFKHFFFAELRKKIGPSVIMQEGKLTSIMGIMILHPSNLLILRSQKYLCSMQRNIGMKNAQP